MPTVEQAAPQMAEIGVILCSFSHAVERHPNLIECCQGSVVPPGDDFYAALNSKVFSDGSFVYVPAGVRCPMELQSYFRINARNADQFGRTMIIAQPGSHKSATSKLHRLAARREPAPRRGGGARCARRRADQVIDGAELVSGRRERARRHL
jgi:Fe-S cluster assembly scaffold protein SufB